MRLPSRRFTLITALVGVIIAASSGTCRADWVLLNSTENGDLFYNGEDIQHSASGIATVWTKMVYNEKGIKTMAAQHGPDFEALDHSVHLSEVDCLGRMALSGSTVYFSKAGAVLKIEESVAQWDFIPPGSNRDILYQKVCPK